MTYPTYLMHYGVKGQKWGERQYQFLDGTYTPLGKERRRIGPHDYGSIPEKKQESMSAKEDIRDKLQKMDFTVKKYSVFHNKNSHEENINMLKKDRRALKISDVGLNAMNKCGTYKDYIDPNNYENKLWFLEGCEGEPMGYQYISDLVLQNKSKNEILDLINNSKEYIKNNRDSSNELYENPIWDLYNASYESDLEEYIDSCIKLRDEEKLKHILNLKISEIF